MMTLHFIYYYYLLVYLFIYSLFDTLINVSIHLGFNCSELEFSTNSVHVCGDWRWGRFCDYECYPNYDLVVQKPPYYSCGKNGGWSHGPPNFPDNPENRLPTCMSMTSLRLYKHICYPLSQARTKI